MFFFYYSINILFALIRFIFIEFSRLFVGEGGLRGRFSNQTRPATVKEPERKGMAYVIFSVQMDGQTSDKRNDWSFSTYYNNFIKKYSVFLTFSKALNSLDSGGIFITFSIWFFSILFFKINLIYLINLLVIYNHFFFRLL